MSNVGTRSTPPEVITNSSAPSRAMWVAALTLGLVTGLLIRVRDTPDVDLWLHLRIGDLLRSGQRFGPHPDPLAALADREYVPTQWLAQVVMSFVHQSTGMAGIQVLRLLLVVVLGGAVVLACRALAGPTAAFVAGALTMLAASASWGERPQLVGVLLLAVTSGLWWWASERGSVPWAAVPLLWMWTMLHGSWILGLAVQVVLLLGGLLDGCWQGRSKLLVASIPGLGLGAALLTPLGVHAVLEPFKVSSVARLTANEWQRPSAGNPLLLVVFVACVVTLLGMVRSSYRRWSRALSMLAAVLLALWMVRTIAVGAIVVAPALAHGLDHLVGRPARRPAEAGGAPSSPAAASRRSGEALAWCLAAAVVLVLGGLHVAQTPFREPVSRPVSNALTSLPARTVLAVDGRAVGWTQWAHRDRRPLRDLRAEIYSVPVAMAYEDFQETRPGWQAYARQHEVTAILADRRRPLDKALMGEPAWRIEAEDTDFRLWVLR